MVSRSELRWCVGAAAGVMALTCLPYLLVWSATPPGMGFLGFLVNPDDQCVYLAWMKQASQGHFFLRNLWTADPQRGLNVHLLFWLLGVAARLSSLPLPIVYHAGRILLGMAVLLLFYRFAALFTEEASGRRICFWLAALSAGFGWLYRRDNTGFVDWWQPEAITFQSLYSNTLFCAGLALMLAVFWGLLIGERTRQRRPVILAGIAGGLLANIHSYDVITVAAVWAAYLALRSLWERRVPIRSLVDAALAALIALPAVLYQFYVYTQETVFRQRVALTITHSPAFWKLLMGYGLLVPLAAFGGARCAVRGARPEPEPTEPRTAHRAPRTRAPRALLPIVWAVVGFAIPYVPVSFQRKMAMGLHLPLALLAGLALHRLACGVAARAPKQIQGPARTGVVALVIALTTPTNAAVLLRHVNDAVTQNLSSNGFHPVYWWTSEFDCLRWAGRSLPDDPVLQPLTFTAVLVPPFTGFRVWAGHWSETPAFYTEERKKIVEVNNLFFGRGMSAEERERFLRERGITHVLFGPRERAIDRMASGVVEMQLRTAPFLQPLHTEGSGETAMTIYAVRPRP